MKRNQIIVIASFAGGLAILCFLSWQFLFQGIRKDILDQRAQLDAVVKELEEAKSKAAQHEKFMAEAENVRRGVNFVTARLDSRLPVSEYIDHFWALQANLKLQGFLLKFAEKIVPSKEDAGLSYMEVKVTCTCDYHTLGQFINEAISQKRIVNITEIKLTSNDATGKLGSVKGEMTFRLYLKTPTT